MTPNIQYQRYQLTVEQLQQKVGKSQDVANLVSKRYHKVKGYPPAECLTLIPKQQTIMFIHVI